jgi:hypothetical protein
MQRRPPGTSARRTFRSAITGVGEEHRAEAREGVVETSVEFARLDVGNEEARVRDPFLCRLPASGVYEALSRINPDGLAGRSHESGELPGGVTKPAAEIECPIAASGWVQAKPPQAMRTESCGDDVAEAHEAVEENAVPGRDRHLVREDNLAAADPRAAGGHGLARAPPKVTAGPPARG